ncbi:glycosyltransferase family protein [Desulfovibrio sp. TomC]|uniref:glycosyltransferase family protein n=1 Tax=Desulfovibrio sp. TomC TaxID=1562888 RepID=UPI000575A0C4|nr:glycosyltransferase [Desulfovibrio sp. TomC]KHK01875.1 CgeB family protein [Desulfovibrio sp. TomC]
MLTIKKSDFKKVKDKKPFAKRPYAFIFIKRSDYVFLDGLEDAFEAIGVKGYGLDLFPWTQKQEFIARLIALIVQVNPDFVLTLSHNGVDPEGDLGNLLGDLDVPLVSWLLDSPGLILSPFRAVVGDNVFLFSTDASALPELSQLGYKHAFYLPLGVNAHPRASGDGLAPAAVHAAENRLLFVGETFSAKIGRYIKTTPSLVRLLPAYKKIAGRLVAERAKTVVALLAEEGGPYAAWYHALGSAPVRQKFDLIVSLYANKLYRTAVLARAIAKEHLIVGPLDWKNALKDRSINLMPSNYDRSFIAGLYKAATITLNITSVHMHGAANERVFDVPFAGGFLLTDSSDQIAGLFEVGQEIATYSGADDFVEQYKRYAQDGATRAKYSENARKRIDAEHTYVHRAATMVSILKAARA